MAPPPTVASVKRILPNFEDSKVVLVGKKKRRFIVHTEVLKRCDYFKAAAEKKWTNEKDEIELITADVQAFSTIVDYLYSNALTLPIDPAPTSQSSVQETHEYEALLIDVYCLAHFLGIDTMGGLIVQAYKELERATNQVPTTRSIPEAMKNVPPESALVRYFVHSYATLKIESILIELKKVPAEFSGMVTAFLREQWGKKGKFVWAYEVKY